MASAIGTWTIDTPPLPPRILISETDPLGPNPPAATPPLGLSYAQDASTA